MKKGFTLVELLAVIAIVVILVIIAIPNVLKMFNNAKYSAFETEVKEIAKTAEKQWLKDSVFASSSKVYAKCNDGSCNNPLDMNTSVDLEYYVNLDSQGKINQMYVKDNSFQYILEGEFDINNITGIEKISDIDESRKIAISGNDVTIGDPSNYTIKFDPVDGNVSVTIRQVQAGSTIGTMPKPTKSGFYFMGWKDETTGDYYYATTIPTKNVTLTAQWSNKNYVARIGDNYYTNIQAAVDAANPGDEVVILVNLSGANFTNNKKLTVNFNGISLSSFKAINEADGDLTLINGAVNRTYSSGDNYIIKNNGKLSIGNYGKNDGISIVHSDSSSISYSSYYVYGIYCGNNSTTIINSGTISSRATAKTGGRAYGIYCGSNISNCNIIVNGGNISTSIKGGYGYGISSSGNVTINGGKISGASYGIYGKNVEYNSGEIIAEGKKVKNEDNTYTLYNGYGIYSTENTTIKLGTITATAVATSYGVYSKGNVTVLGGTINSTGSSQDTSSATGIYADGNVTLTNAIVTCTRPKNSNSSSTVTVGTDALGVYGNSVTVTNSTITSTGKGKSSATGGVRAKKDITFNSGNLTVTGSISQYGVRGLETSNVNDGDVIINGGTVAVKSEDTSSAYGVYCYSSKNYTVTFNDGIVKVKGTNSTGFYGNKYFNVKQNKKLNETTDADGYKVYSLINQ